MAGKLCPNCSELAFFLTEGRNRKCTKCGLEMIVPLKQGEGRKCSNCGKFAVTNEKCTCCGAEYSEAEKTE